MTAFPGSTAGTTSATTTTTPTSTSTTSGAVPAQPAGAERTTASTAVQPAGGRPRGWAAAGLVAALAGIGGIVASGMADGVYQPQLAGDADGIVAAMAEQVPQLLAFHLATMLAVVLLPVVAAGLHRRLRATTPQDSLLPVVAGAGLGLTAVAGLMGTALDTEFIFALAEPEVAVAETVVSYGHWVGTVAWLWVGAGLSAVAVAAAWLRYRAVPRWLGVVSLVLGGLTLLLGISPLQYMAGMVGPVWLLVASLGFLFGDSAAKPLTAAR